MERIGSFETDTLADFAVTMNDFCRNLVTMYYHDLHFDSFMGRLAAASGSQKFAFLRTFIIQYLVYQGIKYKLSGYCMLCEL